jgi:hypothetical protein
MVSLGGISWATPDPRPNERKREIELRKLMASIERAHEAKD